MGVSNEQRAGRLVRAIEVSVSGDVSAVEDLFTPQVTGSSPAMSVWSREDLAIELEEHEDAFSDIHLEVDPLDVSGDQACVEWVASALHSGPLIADGGEPQVIAPTGRRVTLRGVTVAEFDGDKIRSFRHYWDDVALLDTLGLLPDD